MMKNSNQTGVTMTEMLVVVAIIAVCAGIAIPSADSIAPPRADAAAGEVVRALRFAQQEAVRIQKWHQVSIDKTNQTIRVYRLVTEGTVEDTAHPTLHPIDKRRYNISFNDAPMGKITAVSFNYNQGTSGANFVSFGPDGSPGEVTSSKRQSDFKELKAGRITVSYDRQQRIIDLSPVTGRVSVLKN
jgi:prepilin-type N-terminal cleavage/methylation domain-containing protein